MYCTWTLEEDPEWNNLQVCHNNALILTKLL